MLFIRELTKINFITNPFERLDPLLIVPDPYIIEVKNELLTNEYTE